MNRVFNTKTVHILIINMMLLILYVIFYGRFGDINIDSFREAYIPVQMLDGQVLYKNIFNIYAPLAYIFNTFLFSVFGTGLNTLYAAGLLATGGILTLVYKISCRFLPPLYGFAVVMFMIGAGVLGSNVFNYIFPYSFGMLYGLLLILASVYSALNNRFFPAYFLYSLAICFKYEFIFLLPVLIWYSRKTNHFKNFLGLIFSFILTAIILITQGVTSDDIIASCQWVLAMSSTKTLDWFYGLSGIKFSLGLIPLYLLNLLKIIFPLVLLYYFRNIFTIIATLVYLSFFATPAIFIFIFPLILMLGIIRYRDLKKKQIFLISASILVSFKVFFGFLMQSYGIFFIPFALIPVFVLLSKKLKKAFLVIIFLFAMIFGFRNAVSLTYKTAEVHSDSGILYTYNNYADSLNGLISYIKQNSKDTDIVVVYPEGLSLNFLTDRKSDNKFYSLIPLYVETFGEDIIKSRLELVKPEFIIISNYDTSNYYFKHFGEDYAQNILNFIEENYYYKTTIGNGFIYAVYKRK